jgi:hypothetical protein
MANAFTRAQIIASTLCSQELPDSSPNDAGQGNFICVLSGKDAAMGRLSPSASLLI